MTTQKSNYGEEILVNIKGINREYYFYIHEHKLGYQHLFIDSEGNIIDHGIMNDPNQDIENVAKFVLGICLASVDEKLRQVKITDVEITEERREIYEGKLGN